MKRINTKSRLNKTVCLKDELDNFIKYIGLDSNLQELKILEIWNECVGEAIAQYSRPVELNKNKLLISVENSVWRYELSMRKTEIITKLNEQLKKNIIKDIVFV